MARSHHEVTQSHARGSLAKALQPNGLVRADAVIAPEGPAKALAVIVSGDGGWQELERVIGGALAQRGIAVIGIDSRRYFWAGKEPRQVAFDIARLVRGYGGAFETRRYALVGFSFGADIMADVWPLLPRRIQDRVALVSLLAPSRYADFEVTVATLLGVPSARSRPLTPLLYQLPLERTQCLYGRREADRSACNADPMRPAEVVEFPGGHTFEGDYTDLSETVARRLLERIAGEVPPVPIGR
jgi:type IV secretory pathway VirJ component